MTFDPSSQQLDADEVHHRVNEAITGNDIVLFMKGDARMPQCGFSKRALGLIRQYRDEIETVDTLQNLDAFREELKAESGWDTIPQTFVEGEFVGGSDILAELDERGDLAETLNADPDMTGNETSTTDDADIGAPF